MNQDFPALAAMMESCFHQDMDLEAETVPESVALYALGLSAAAGHTLRADIDRFRNKHAGDLEHAFLQDFAAELDPREAGFSIADFLQMVESVVGDPASFRQFLEEQLRADFPHLRRLARACLDLPYLSAEARRLGLIGADSMPDALSIHINALPPADRRALLAELQQFEALYGDDATQVFGKRWFDLEHSAFGSFRQLRLEAERISINLPAD